MDGTYPHPADRQWTGTPGFRGFGRSETISGEYGVRTVPPGARHGAPHVLISVFARGLLDRLVTRAYLPDPPDDPVLASDGRSALDGLRRAFTAGDGFGEHLQ